MQPLATATTLLRLHCLSWGDSCRFSGTCLRGRTHAERSKIMRNTRIPQYKGIPVFDMLSHGQEGLLNICRILGGSLKERNIQLIRKFLVEISFKKCRIRISGNIPLPQNIQRPSCSSNLICCQQAAYSHPPMHIGQFPEAIV